MYEFVLVNLYTKISEKRDLHPVGISTRDQYGLQSTQRAHYHHPAASISAILFIYRKIRTPSEKRDMYKFIRATYSHPLLFVGQIKLTRGGSICPTNKTVRIETYTSRFGGKVLTDEKSHDFFNVPKLHPTHRWKRLLPISVPVPS